MTEKVVMTETLEKIKALTFDSRERKKSKYLSYPYINLGPGHIGLPAKTEDSQVHIHSHKVEGSNAATNHFNGSPSTVKSGRKRFRGNWCRKFIQWSTLFCSPDFTNTSSTELLSGLYSKAVGCNFPNENRQSDLVEWFFCTYRLSAYHDEAELPASLINLKGGNSGAPVRNKSPDVNTEQEKRKKKKPEHTLRLRTKSLSSQADKNISTATSEFLSKCSMEINTTKPWGNMEEVSPLLQLQNVGTTYKGSSATCSLIPEGLQVLSRLAFEDAAEPKRRKKMVAAPENLSSKTFLSLPNVGEKANKCSSLVIDLQMVSPSTNGISEKNNAENREELDLIGSNPELYASQPCVIGNIANHSLLVSATSEVTVASVSKTLQKRRKRKEKAPVEHLTTKIATVIPDLNDCSTEYNSTRKELENVNSFSQELKYKHNQQPNQEPKSELSRSIFAGIELTQTINYNRMAANGDAQGTCLLLQFDPGVSFPSKEDLLATFFRFGPLKVRETQMLKDGHAQIVFIRSADAGEAFRSVEQNKPFGTTLLDCKLHHFSATISPIEQCVMTTGPTCSKPLHCERPSLDFIRQNLQMMASTLEKSGDNISPQIRDKLEGEITNLLEKVNSIAGSCSMKA